MISLGSLVGCKGKDAPAAAPPAPVAIDAAATTPPPAAIDAAAAAAKDPPVAFDPKALDDALAAKGVAADAVASRATGPASAWAVVVTRRDDVDEVAEYLVIRADASGAAELKLEPPTSNGRRNFDKVVSLEAKDLDGDGHDEGLLVLGWTRSVSVKKPYVSTMEQAEQLHVLGGTPLASEFTHLVSYESSSQSGNSDDGTPYPDPEEITYTWSVTPGKPATVKLARTKFEVATEYRLAGTVNPSSDPLLAAGEGKDITLSLK